MANNVTRMPQQQITDPASQWFWNGSQWVCGCDPDDGTQPPVVIQPGCPPPFFPPPITQPPWYPGANGGVSFGTTAPPNPIRGAFWWDGKVLWMFDGAAWVNTATGQTAGTPGGGSSASGAGTVIISTSPPGNPQVGAQWWDGSVLRVWDGVQWMVVGPGASAGPVPTTTHVFSLVQPTNLTTSTSAWGIVPFTAQPLVDPLLMYNPVTYKITPTKAGVYLWFIRNWVNLATNQWAATGLVKNDSGTVTNASEWVAIGETTDSGTNLIAAWLAAGGISIMNGTTDFVRIFTANVSGTWYGTNISVLEGYLLP